MKKILAILMASAMLLALASCGEEPAETSSAAPTVAPTVTPTVAPIVTPTVAPTPTPEPEVEDSLMAKGAPICDSVNAQYGGEATAAFDGDIATRWQSNAKGNDGDDGWIGMQWEEEVTFDTIICDWETAHPAKDGFKVQISDDGNSWKDIKFKSERTGEDADDHQIDTITFDAVTTKAVRVLCQTAYVIPEGRENAGSTKESPSCWEMQIIDSTAVEEEPTEETSAEEVAE